MEISHQKNLVHQDFPFNLMVTDVTEFPPHWHKEMEIVYLLEGILEIGLNNRVYTLNPRDILFIGKGDVHYFLTGPEKNSRIIIHFDPSAIEYISPVLTDKRLAKPLIEYNTLRSNRHSETHLLLEKQILSLNNEYQNKKEGYKPAVMARLYDLIVIMLRYLPLEELSPLEKNKQQKKLERLEQVFRFVENNYDRSLSLTEVAAVADFSIYHFTRFFKDTTGMTFLHYLNNYRISKAVKYLLNTTDSITEVAFKSGFDSIKTFNRVFKKIKGCSPSVYRKQYLSND